MTAHATVAAEQGWLTRVRARMAVAHESLGRTVHRFQQGDIVELTQGGAPGAPIDRDTWWTTDCHRIPAAKVEVLEILDDTPPFKKRPGTVYLLHFHAPFGHARHYLGYTDGVLEQRLAQHGSSVGARLMWHVAQAGIGWRLARTWPGDRRRERQLKIQGGHSRKCPICWSERAERPVEVRS